MDDDVNSKYLVMIVSHFDLHLVCPGEGHGHHVPPLFIGTFAHVTLL